MQKKFETILVEVGGKKATLTLNRPQELNTMNFLVVEEMIEALSALKREKINCIVLTGSGNKFCAGADIKEMRPREATEWGKIVERYLDLINALVEFPLPIVAKINGDAVGGGLGLCTASDIRVAVNTARLGFPFIKLGLSGSDMGSSYFLPKLVGFSKAAEMLYTGELLKADDAEKVGLIHKSVKPEEFEAVVDRYVSTFTQGPRYALSFTKRALVHSMDNNRYQQFDFETYAQTQCLQSECHREGVSAFRDKRTPNYP